MPWSPNHSVSKHSNYTISEAEMGISQSSNQPIYERTEWVHGKHEINRTANLRLKLVCLFLAIFAAWFCWVNDYMFNETEQFIFYPSISFGLYFVYNIIYTICNNNKERERMEQRRLLMQQLHLLEQQRRMNKVCLIL